MSLLGRYVARTLAANVFVALTALVVVFSVVNLTQELEDVGIGRYRFGDALAFIALTLPAEAFELLPAAALLGGVLGIGGMAARNEVAALSAAGVSGLRLVRLVLQGTVLIVALAMVAGEFVAAPLARHAHTQRSVLLSEGLALTTPHGLWARDGSRFVNVRSAQPDGRLNDVYVYDFDPERRLRRFTYARRAAYAGGQWRLEELVETSIDEQGTQTRRLPGREWQGFVSPKRLRVLSLRPEDLSLADLASAIGSLRGRGESTARHELAFWRRATTPLVATIMVLLGLPLVVGTKRLANLGQRIIVGALLGVGFQMLSQTFGGIVLTYELGPLVGALLLPALGAAAGLWALRRAL
jgi:lipopolysaccharide export system permease protein